MDRLARRRAERGENYRNSKPRCRTELPLKPKKREAKKLGELLKRELGARSPLQNEEFFSHQLRERIAQESGEATSGALSQTVRHHGGRFLVCCGRARLRSLSFWFAPFSSCAGRRPAEESQYLTQILNARVDPVVSPNATVSIFEVKQDRVTVLWTEGLQSLPADYAAK